MPRIAFSDAVTMPSTRSTTYHRYERIVSCNNCHEPDLMFGESSKGNRWLYKISDFLTPEQVEQVRTDRSSWKDNFLREVAIGRDADGKLGTKFVLLLKHMPHPACRLENQLLDQEAEVPENQVDDELEAERAEAPDYDGADDLDERLALDEDEVRSEFTILED